MSKLEKIINIGFKINWKFIEIGYLGLEYIPQQIDKDDIREYGYYLIEKMSYSSDSFETIVQLFDELLNDYEFEEILKKLAQREKSKQELQIRKWIVYLTKKMIDTLDDDFIENLINITEFWVSLGQPPNSPHIFQGVNNIISPKEYYTKDMYDLIIDTHKKWIEKEIKEIIALENKELYWTGQ